MLIPFQNFKNFFKNFWSFFWRNFWSFFWRFWKLQKFLQKCLKFFLKKFLKFYEVDPCSRVHIIGHLCIAWFNAEHLKRIDRFIWIHAIEIPSIGKWMLSLKNKSQRLKFRTIESFRLSIPQNNLWNGSSRFESRILISRFYQFSCIALNKLSFWSVWIGF